MASTSSSLIMGFAAKLPPEMLMPFFRSLERTSYRGQTCLFAAFYEPEQLEQLKQVVDHLVVVATPANWTLDATATTVRLLGFARSTRGMRRFYPALFRMRCALARERDSYELWSGLELRSRACRRCAMAFTTIS